MTEATRITSVSPLVSPVHGAREPLRASRAAVLAGSIRPPGDKSISHRALIFGLLALGRTSIRGLLEGEDVLHTAAACRALGAVVERQEEGIWSVQGAGLGRLREPETTLDFGNAGTGTRLMMGVVGGHAIAADFDGDASLRSRPMRRILDPLELMGCRVIEQAPGGRCPIRLRGTDAPLPIVYESPVASAQIKSAILLAGLSSPGQTVVIEREASRDHTERMLLHFGAAVASEPFGAHGRRITLQGRPRLVGAEIAVPADPSSASFALVAGAVVPGSDVLLEGVMMNPLRTGLLTTLLEMGADITIEALRQDGGEQIANLRVRGSRLRGVDVPARRAPSMIDEYPILAVAASVAQGTSRMRGLSELRVKESDRLAAIAAGLELSGVRCAIEGDDLVVEGCAGLVPGGATIATHLDHRIAMSFLVLGLTAAKPITIDDGRMIKTSFPSFVRDMIALGASLT